MRSLQRHNRSIAHETPRIVFNNCRAAGVEATVMAPEPLAAFMRAEHEKWGRVVRETRATVD
jgi:hypothetical protein